MHSSDSNDFLHPSELESLGRLRNEQGPVFSLYLDLRQDGDVEQRFEDLLRAASEQRKLSQDPPEYRAQWDEDAQRVRQWLRAEYGEDRKAQPAARWQGLAVLCSGETGLWRVLALPAPVPDRLLVKDQPYLRPLEILLAEFPCTLVVLIDADSARLVQVSLGQAREVDQVESVPVTGGGQEGDLHSEGDFQQEGAFARAVAERTTAAWQEQPCGWLVIGDAMGGTSGAPQGGSAGAAGALRTVLPEVLHQRLAGELDLSPQAAVDKILVEVRAVERALEQRLEAERVHELLEKSDGPEAVLGLEQSLLAVRAKKVRMLIAEQDFHLEGGECPNCGFLGVEEQQDRPCLLCGMALRPEPDIIEVALKRVLEQGGEIEVLRSPDWQHALDAHGRIGALLFELELPPAREMANQQAITRDATVEESFPASDPPGSW